VTRVLAFAALLGALLVGVAPAGSVAPGKPGSIVFANGDALGRGTVLELADPSGRGVPRALTARALSAAMPAVSPDGRRVAFASLARKGGGIEVLTLASRAIARVTSVAGDADPAWSPDGKQLVFARLLAKGGHQLMLVAASGGAVTKAAGALGRRPDYAPDGKRIVFQQDGARSGIAVVTASGGAPVGLGPGASPSWSPDGLTIAFTAPVSGVSHLFLVAPDGTNRRDITHFSPVSQPSWSPDGTHLVLVTRTAAGTCCGLVTVDATGNGRIRITHGLVFASRPVWAPAS
jgi:Tol biopolymer transport system component